MTDEPQPLRGRMYWIEKTKLSDMGAYFKKEAVASAVKWLKEEIGYCENLEERLIVIDEAFADVIEDD